MRRCHKFSLIFIVVIVTLLSTALPVFAAYGSTDTIDIRWDSQYNCVAPADASYSYVYLLNGTGEDFTWLGADYMIVWSRERCVIKDNNLVFSEPFYFYPGKTEDSLYNILFTKSSKSTANVYKSEGQLKSRSLQVIYSNRQFMVDDLSYDVVWPFAIENSDTSIIKVYFGSIFNGLSSVHIKLFGTKISMFGMIVGPFVISISIMIMMSLLGVGGEYVGFGIRVSRNYIKRNSGKKRNSGQSDNKS